MKDNSSFFKGILESHPGLMVFTLDNQYRYTYFTKTHQQIMKSFWGKTISIGDNMLEFISDPSIRKSAEKSFDKALEGKSFVQVKNMWSKINVGISRITMRPSEIQEEKLLAWRI